MLLLHNTYTTWDFFETWNTTVVIFAQQRYNKFICIGHENLLQTAFNGNNDNSFNMEVKYTLIKIINFIAVQLFSYTQINVIALIIYCIDIMFVIFHHFMFLWRRNYILLVKLCLP